VKIKHFLQVISTAFAFVFQSSAQAQGFDWSFLSGVWAESTDHKFGCGPENLHQRLEISADRKTLTFKNDRRWKIGTGQEVEKYSAAVIDARENVLVIKYGAELEGIPDEYRTWEIRFLGPSTYRWRAASWPPGQFNEVIGVKCRQ
jgi:hypothetical protein